MESFRNISNFWDYGYSHNVTYSRLCANESPGEDLMTGIYDPYR